MSKKITGFAYLPTAEQKSISYTFNEIDENSNIIKANIRRSYAVQASDVDLQNNIDAILNVLTDKLNSV
jgi:hypothetical protein